jgi:serine/threonine-protein kinase
METEAPPPADPLLGRMLEGRYRIDSVIGQGGMGVVYRGFQPAMDRAVAIKVLRAELGRDAAIVKRFEREARAASRLSHPNIITLYDFGQTHDRLMYIVMELLDGEPLRTTLQREGAIGPARALDIAFQLGDALSSAHAAGVVHRDLKPENVFRRAVGVRPDFLKILDFGVAKLVTTEPASQITSAGMVLGTPLYMSPEQVLGEEVDHRADLYAVGIMLYEMLVGDHPFRDTRAVAVLLNHLQKEPPRLAEVAPALSKDLELQRVLDRAMAKRPEARFQSAAEMLAALASVQVDGAPAGESILRTGSSPKIRNDAALAVTRAPELPAPTIPPVGSAEVQPVALTVFPRSRRRGLKAGAALALLGAGAIAVYLGLREPEESVPSPRPPRAAAPAVANLPAPTPVATPVPAPAPKPEPPRPPRKVTLDLRSRPSAATVLRDGSRAGRTPFKLSLEPSKAVVVLRFEHSGYSPEVRKVVPRADEVIDVKLSKIVRARRPKPKPAPPAPKPKALPAEVPPLPDKPPPPPKPRLKDFEL